MKFVQAKSYSRAKRSLGDITLVVIHTMEAPERDATAENVAAWFAGPSAPQASAHYNVDGDSVVQSVHEHDVAWHAGPVNGYSIGVEHAGYAKQTPEEWADAYSIAMLDRSAELVAGICRRHAIPITRVTDEDLRAGRRSGLCGHVDVTRGLTGGKGHWDPGPHFPWEWYLERVRSYFTAAATVPAPPRLGIATVADVQKALARLGYSPGPVDSDAGPKTRSAVRAFQAATPGLVVDGDAGPKTRAALEEALVAEPPRTVRDQRGTIRAGTEGFAPVEYAGSTWLVSPMYVAPVSIGEAKQRAAALGFELPTPGLVDAIWRQADLRVSPALTIQKHDGTVAGMNAAAVYERVRSGIEQAIGDRALGRDFKMLAGAFKDVVEVGGKVGLYGWHVDDVTEFDAAMKKRLGFSLALHVPETSGPGRVVQQPYFGHSAAWRDYSQGLRFCRRA